MSCQADKGSNLQARLERRLQEVGIHFICLRSSIQLTLMAGWKYLLKPNLIRLIPDTALVFRLLAMVDKSIIPKPPLLRVRTAAVARALDTVCLGMKAIRATGKSPFFCREMISGLVPLLKYKSSPFLTINDA